MDISPAFVVVIVLLVAGVTLAAASALAMTASGSIPMLVSLAVVLGLLLTAIRGGTRTRGRRWTPYW